MIIIINTWNSLSSRFLSEENKFECGVQHDELEWPGPTGRSLNKLSSGLEVQSCWAFAILFVSSTGSRAGRQYIYFWLSDPCLMSYSNYRLALPADRFISLAQTDFLWCCSGGSDSYHYITGRRFPKASTVIFDVCDWAGVSHDISC